MSLLIIQRYLITLSILTKALEQSRRVDPWFDVVAVFARELPVDLIGVSQFVYRHIALQSYLPQKRPDAHHEMVREYNLLPETQDIFYDSS